MRKTVSIPTLRIGDLIEVAWADASELPRTKINLRTNVDFVIRSVGYYGGLRGRLMRHLILIKEIFPKDKLHVNNIPVPSILQVTRFTAKAMNRVVRDYAKASTRLEVKEFVEMVES